MNLKSQSEYTAAWNKLFTQNSDLFVDRAPELSLDDYQKYFIDKHGPFLNIYSPVLYKIDILNKYKDNIFRYYPVADSNGVKHIFIIQIESNKHLTAAAFYLDEQKNFYIGITFNILDSEYVKEFEEENKNFRLALPEYREILGFGQNR